MPTPLCGSLQSILHSIGKMIFLKHLFPVRQLLLIALKIRSKYLPWPTRLLNYPAPARCAGWLLPLFPFLILLQPLKSFISLSTAKLFPPRVFVLSFPPPRTSLLSSSSFCDKFLSFRSGFPGRHCPLTSLSEVTTPAIHSTHYNLYILCLVTLYFPFPHLYINSTGGRNNVYAVYHKIAEGLAWARHLTSAEERGRVDSQSYGGKRKPQGACRAGPGSPRTKPQWTPLLKGLRKN